MTDRPVARLAVFAAALAGAIGLGAAVGSTAGPIGDDDAEEHRPAPTEVPVHESHP